MYIVKTFNGDPTDVNTELIIEAANDLNAVKKIICEFFEDISEKFKDDEVTITINKM